MEDNSIIIDALRLARAILDSLLPENQWAIVNIATDKRETFVLEGYPSIPTSFGYKYDKTPVLLEKHGVIEEKTSGWWFMCISDIDSYWARYIRPDLTIIDDIDWEIHKKGYVGENKLLEYYYDDTESIGPRKHGQAAVLINVKSLKNFIKKQSIDALDARSKVKLLSQKAPITFDEIKSCISIGQIEVKIRPNTDQHNLCKVILKDSKSKTKQWEWEEMLEKWGETELYALKNKKMKIYRAAREINKKVAQTIQAKDFFIYTTNTVRLNPNFL